MEENQKILFKGEATYTLAAIKEHHKYSIFFDYRELVLLSVFLLLLLLSWFSIQIREVFSYAILLLGIYLLVRRLGFQCKTTYNRTISQNEGNPVQNFYQFGDHHIHVQRAGSHNEINFQFSQITGLAQTKHYFVLLLEHRQYVLLEKDTLSGGKSEDFISYLRNICPNLKPKKLRSNRLGRIIYYATIIMVCLSLILPLLDLVILLAFY